MPWVLRLAPQADKDLDRLPAKDRQAVVEGLERLIADPGSADLRKLAGREHEWRLRVGRWRVRLALDNRAGTITVLRILPRSTAYRD